MERKERKEEIEIDLIQLFHVLRRKAWIIVLAMVISGGCVLGYTHFVITPMYKARTLLYVNNRAQSVETAISISQGDLNASQGLVDTYIVILRTRDTLSEVVERANLTYSCDKLSKMISAGAVNGTQMLYVDVKSENPAEAAFIANTIGQVLPEKISSIVEGSSVKIVDYATEPAEPSSPNHVKNSVLGILSGFVGACIVILTGELTDNQIHNSDYLPETFGLPVLAVIPDLTDSDTENNFRRYGHTPATKGGKR